MIKSFSGLTTRLLTKQRYSQYSSRASHVISYFKSPHGFAKKTMATQAAPVPIKSAPSAGQSVEHNGRVYTTIREGQAYILVPPNAQTSLDPQAKSKAGEHIQLKSVFSLSMRMADSYFGTREWFSSAKCLLQPNSAIQSRPECTCD